MDIFAKDFNLEASLAKDHNGMVLSQIKDTLTQIQNRLKRKMDLGLTPEAFKQTEELSEALNLSQVLMEKSWNTLHKN